MRAKNILLAGAIGTTFMTVFSYILSKKRKRNFSEPKLLQALLQSSGPASTTLSAKVAAWALHYITGIAFTTTYAFTLKLLKTNPSLLKAFVFGILAGGVSIVVWKMLFSFNHKYAKLKDDEYFLQLFIAHIVFGLMTSQFYALLDQQKHASEKYIFLNGGM
jgi:hypothetical protein